MSEKHRKRQEGIRKENILLREKDDRPASEAMLDRPQWRWLPRAQAIATGRGGSTCKAIASHNHWQWLWEEAMLRSPAAEDGGCT
ncbi:hypothetical protein B296_00012447 [Ensete ventricosum]|uniref:Uncharacterized protein n=1 Tax=Ensete ventricosum TaxID=4639 RepID=A0A427A0L1_ENSVE|nr:hypothetical protein B296_00012447 [Ensete ventricosum]